MAEDAPRLASADQRRPLATPTCDYDAFVTRLGGDVMLAREMAAAFVADSPRLVAQLRDAIAGGDANAVGRAVHAIKGAAVNFDAADTVAVAVQLEYLVRDGDLAGAPALAAQLEAAMAQLVASLRAFGGS